jgi:GT2 family glycosyltransferase
MPKTKVLHTENRGLAAARNSGITEACGEFILPLDADDTISADYLEKGVPLLEGSPSIGVVYGLADYFGARSGRWELPEYSSVGLLSENMIFCSALFRRSDWKRVGGYKTAMAHGWEDWEFWLSLSELGVGFARIPAVLFHYRVRHASMTSSLTYWQKFLMMGVMVLHHPKLYRCHAFTVIRSLLRSWV